MKVLFVGDLNEYARSFQRFRALKELGHNVTGLSFVPIGYKPGISTSISIIDRICNKLGYPLDKIGINKEIISHLNSQDVDLLWIEKGLMIRPSTLKHAKKLQPTLRIVSYTEDDMFVRHNQSSYYRGCLPLYDVVITTKSYNANPNELPALGAKRIIFVDKAFDIHTHRPLPITEEDKTHFGADVGFIGTFEQDRADKMLFLAKNGIRVRIWGNGWDGWVNKHPNLTVENRPIYGDDYVKSICAAKINLCFLRKMNRDLQTDRTMEIPACGAFMLAERTDEHRQLFEEDKEAVYFSSERELLEKVRYYLRHEDRRQAIAEAGRQRCLESGYSHHDRLRFILREVHEYYRPIKYAKIFEQCFLSPFGADFSSQAGATIILSFQNSGSHLFRTFLESKFRRPTLGVTNNKYSDIPIMLREVGISCSKFSPIAIKAHTLDDIFDAAIDGIQLNGKMIFIVRNPVDAVYSYARHLLFPLRSARYGHRSYIAGIVRSVQNTLFKRHRKKIATLFKNYLDLVVFFLHFAGEKAFLRFEDLIKGHVSEEVVRLFRQKDEDVHHHVFDDISSKARRALRRRDGAFNPPKLNEKRRSELLGILMEILENPEYVDAKKFLASNYQIRK